MGVKGLCGLIESNPSLQKRHLLHDCTVVIDGWNVAFRLYLGSPFDCVLGGEYASYADEIRRYFALYKEANVQCIVMLDGAYDPSNSKLGTIQKRTMDRIMRMKRLQSEYAMSIKVMPCLATDVFRDVLSELNIQVIQCVFEADEHIARQANMLNCPVISDDSDFYVYDLRAGLIKLSSLDRRTIQRQVSSKNGQTITVRGIECTIFMVENLLKLFGGKFNRELLPLFGAIVGNDFVSEDTFSKFFETIRVPRAGVLTYRPPHHRMVAMLNFLAQQDSLDDCIDIVLRYIPKNRRQKLRQLMVDGIARYRSELADEKVYFRNGTAVPNWVVKRFIAGHLPSEVITMIATGINYVNVRLEPVHMRSSNEVTLPLRKSIYGVVFKGEANVITELDRSGHGIQFHDIEFPDGEIGLSGIPQLSADRRTSIFKKSILSKADCSNLVQLPEGKLLIYALEYMVNYGNFSRQMCLAMLVTHVVTQATAARTPEEQISYLLAVRIDPSEVRNFDGFFRKPPPHHRINVKLTHLMNEYIACLDTIQTLNRILGVFQDSLKFHLVINGVFTYNFYNDLRIKSDESRYLARLLRPQSRLHTSFERLWTKIGQHLFPKNPAT